MRRGSPRFLLAVAVAGVILGSGASSAAPPTCTLGEPGCMPTPAECATGENNGVTPGGGTGRLALCAAAEGHTIVYAGGTVVEPCGAIVVADQPVAGDPAVDPNTCPGGPFDAPPGEPTGGGGFLNYPAPGSAYGGETSIGVNHLTNNTMFQTLLRTYRVSWDDAASPDVPAATWTDVSYLPESINTGDPIMWTDQMTGRTIVSQMEQRASSAIQAFTDDDGETWQLTQPPSGLPGAGHQTLGGGAYSSPVPSHLFAYPNAVYFCAAANDLGVSATSVLLATNSSCARSDDGGVTWGPPVMSNRFQCSTGHGHVAVAPDGTVALPFGNCFGDTGGQGVMVSKDNGLTWQRYMVPGTQIHYDPQVAFDRAGRLYFVATSNHHPVVATSDDAGRSWTALTDVGTPFGIQNSTYQMATAGDAGRAAFGFYGTTTPGDDQSPAFDGAWHLFVATTIDGGATWTTVDATPDDPVQRGCIWLGGGTNPCRNLLDFQGITYDRDGRVLVGYADGCTSATCTGPTGTPDDSRDSHGTIARQITGDRMLASPHIPPVDACTPGEGGCLPSVRQCRSGHYNGYFDGGATGRMGICAAQSGVVLFYAAGNVNTPCGAIVIADQVIAADGVDPNSCA